MTGVEKNMPENQKEHESEVQTNNEPEEHEHEHHHHRRKKSKLKPFLYSVMAFFLSFVLFLLSICMVLEFTVFSKDYMINTMDSKGYYSMVRYELQSCLTDLVYASGFEPEFAVSFANGYDVKKAVESYINSFYAGDNNLVDTTEFKQQLYAEVQNYAKQNNIEITDSTEENIIYFVNEAANIYKDQISIPFFSVIGKYIDDFYNTLNIIIGVLTALALGISAVIYFTNRYKHRRYKYLCYGLAGGALSSIIIPIFISASNIIPKINITTRSLYNLFVGYFTGLFSYFYICSGAFAILALLAFLLYVKYYEKYRTA